MGDIKINIKKNDLNPRFVDVLQQWISDAVVTRNYTRSETISKFKVKKNWKHRSPSRSDTDNSPVY